jgi:DNA-binding response OmpR family regulator
MNSASPTLPQQTVLLVEDDESIRDGMASLLVQAGYLVLTAATGHDAIGLLRTPLRPIDVVLLDIQLPDVSGVDLCARVREIFPKIPVIVCSGDTSPKERTALRKLGIKVFLQKPVDMEELLAALRTNVSS